MTLKQELKAFSHQLHFHPKKRLGQNFLIDKRILGKIITSSQLKPSDSIIEIGAGFGVITKELIEMAKKAIALEIDRDLCSLLKDRYKNNKNIDIICGDILKFDIKAQSKILNTKFKIIGNLPYYITSPIIVYLINNRRYIQSAFITVQKEVAQRITSAPGKKTYGSLSLLVQFYTKPEVLFTIPSGSFFPSPEVESAFLRLDFLERPTVHVKDEAFLFKLIRASFNKRRKYIINSLMEDEFFKTQLNELKSAFFDAGIDLKRRADTLSLDEFAKITGSLLQ